MSRGIELRASLNGRPIVQANSFVLHELGARTLGVGGWLAMFGGPAHLVDGTELLVEYRAAYVPGDEDPDDPEPDPGFYDSNSDGFWSPETLVWEGDQA